MHPQNLDDIFSTQTFHVEIPTLLMKASKHLQKNPRKYEICTHISEILSRTLSRIKIIVVQFFKFFRSLDQF